MVIGSRAIYNLTPFQWPLTAGGAPLVAQIRHTEVTAYIKFLP